MSCEGLHPLAGESLSEAHAVTGRLAEMGVVHEPVDKRTVAMVLGMISSKPEGCRFELTATDLRS